MRPRILLAATAVALSLAACSETTTAPRRFQPGALRKAIAIGPDGSCRSGYHVATRSDGGQVCEED